MHLLVYLACGGDPSFWFGQKPRCLKSGFILWTRICTGKKGSWAWEIRLYLSRPESSTGYYYKFGDTWKLSNLQLDSFNQEWRIMLLIWCKPDLTEVSLTSPKPFISPRVVKVPKIFIRKFDFKSINYFYEPLIKCLHVSGSKLLKHWQIQCWPLTA